MVSTDPTEWQPEQTLGNKEGGRESMRGRRHHREENASKWQFGYLPANKREAVVFSSSCCLPYKSQFTNPSVLITAV